MKIVGIVAEYNPLHNGHLYHIEQAKKDADVLIVVMGGNYSMRGGVAPMDKFIKTSLVLKYGVDLVVELPTVYAIQSADIFALAAVSILNELHCTDIYFGSESDDINYLHKVVSLTEKKSYSELLHEFMGQGFSYPKSSAMALESLGIPTLESCDQMNVCYLKALKEIKSLIVPHTVKRETKYASATSIRMFGPTIDMVPEEIMEYYRNYGFNHMNNYYDLLRYKITLNNPIKDEGLENALDPNQATYQDLVRSLISKRYTESRISRYLVKTLLDLKLDFPRYPSYIRVLGMNTCGREYLNTIKKDINLISKVKEGINEVLDFELRASQIYSLKYHSNVFRKELLKPIIV